MSYFITGGNGLIGLECVSQLSASGITTHALYRRVKGPDLPHVTWIQGDLNDFPTIEQYIKKIQPNHCIHTAWNVEHGQFWESPSNLEDMRSTIALYTSFSQNGGKCFVGAGTGYEYNERYSVCVEDETPLEPQTFYGQCKKTAFEMISKLNAQQKESCRFVWARFFNIFGAREHPDRLISYIIRNTLRQIDVNLKTPYVIRDFFHAQDAAHALIFLAQHSNAQGAFNTGYGLAMSVERYVHFIVEKITGKSIEMPPYARVEKCFMPVVHKLYNTGFTPKLGLKAAIDLTITEITSNSSS